MDECELKYAILARDVGEVMTCCQIIYCCGEPSDSVHVPGLTIFRGSADAQAALLYGYSNGLLDLVLDAVDLWYVDWLLSKCALKAVCAMRIARGDNEWPDIPTVDRLVHAVKRAHALHVMLEPPPSEWEHRHLALTVIDVCEDLMISLALAATDGSVWASDMLKTATGREMLSQHTLDISTVACRTLLRFSRDLAVVDAAISLINLTTHSVECHWLDPKAFAELRALWLQTAFKLLCTGFDCERQHWPYNTIAQFPKMRPSPGFLTHQEEIRDAARFMADMRYESRLWAITTSLMGEASWHHWGPPARTMNIVRTVVRLPSAIAHQIALLAISDDWPAHQTWLPPATPSPTVY